MRYELKILAWSLAGLVVRLAIMPFTMHGRDLVFTNYFPMLFVTKGVWDPYGFIVSNHPNCLPYFYYGPVLFIIVTAANWVFIHILHAASLVKMLQVSGAMMFTGGTSTLDYVRAFSGLDLFRNLFLMKSPYLIFDFLIGAVLLKLAATKKDALISYALWMLNIVVLHTAYAVGQSDLITAFFIIAALYAALLKRPYLAVISLCAGGATKIFPYVLLLPACLLLGRGWKARISLLSAGCAVSLAMYLPFFLPSDKGAILNYFMLPGNLAYSGFVKWASTGAFLILYVLLSAAAIRDSRSHAPERKLFYYFTAIMFLIYAAYPIRLRFFVYVTPFLALMVPRQKLFGIFMSVVIVLLAFMWLPDRDLQLGLFAPVDADYFLGLSTIQEVMGRFFVNIEIVYKIISRMLILAFFAAAWWVWRIKGNGLDDQNIVLGSGR